MLSLLSAAALTTAVLSAPAAVATTAAWDDAVNTTCPISGAPIDGRTTVTHDGNVVGFCCPGCPGQFKRWDDARKDAYVATALGAMSDDTPPPSTAKRKPEPYTLATCPVSGSALGSMGDPVIKTYEGREVRFCCGGCIESFEADKAKYWKQIDAKIEKEQAKYFPFETCMIMGDDLEEDGEFIGERFVHENRLIELCCRRCVARFRESPERYLAKIDAEVIKKQGPTYPLTKCVVSQNPLSPDGAAAEVVIGNRLVRLCCPGCEGAVRKDPAKYLKIIDDARKAAGG